MKELKLTKDKLVYLNIVTRPLFDWKKLPDKQRSAISRVRTNSNILYGIDIPQSHLILRSPEFSKITLSTLGYYNRSGVFQIYQLTDLGGEKDLLSTISQCISSKLSDGGILTGCGDLDHYISYCRKRYVLNRIPVPQWVNTKEKLDLMDLYKPHSELIGLEQLAAAFNLEYDPDLFSEDSISSGDYSKLLSMSAAKITLMSQVGNELIEYGGLEGLKPFEL